MKKQFKTQYNQNQFPKPKGESNFMASMTLPGQSMSMTEILRRHKNGLPTTGGRTVFYEAEGDIEGMTHDEFRRLDLADQEQIINRRREELDELNSKRIAAEKRLQQNEQDKQAAKVKEARDAYLNKLKELGKPLPEGEQSTNNP